MKKIEMLFYPTLPSEDNSGLKFVLFEVLTNESEIIHEWGFCDWNGTSWGPVEAPKGFVTTVKWWSNTVDPELLLKEKSKIIRI